MSAEKSWGGAVGRSEGAVVAAGDRIELQAQQLNAKALADGDGAGGLEHKRGGGRVGHKDILEFSSLISNFQ